MPIVLPAALPDVPSEVLPDVPPPVPPTGPDGSGPERWRVRRVAGVGLGLCLALAAVNVAGPPAAAVTRDEAQRAATALTEAMDAAGVPGAAYSVVGGSGAPLAGGLGSAGNDVGVTPDTRFVIGSTSKSITALAVLQLVDDEKVQLDAPVRRYVPEFRLATPGAADAITVRQLLHQTSGLAETAGGPILKSVTDGTPLQAVRELSDAELVDQPGTGWHYSNANYVLAGLVVERASGTSYAQHVQRRIFDPLGMTSSTAGPPTTDADGAPAVSTGHRVWFGATVPHAATRRTGSVAAGYLVSTAADLGRYLQLYLRDGLAPNGTRVISATGLDTLTSPGPTAHLGGWADGASARYAMGWFVGGPWGQQPVLFHPGNSPDTSAMIAVVPGRAVAVATVMNLSHETPLPGNPSVTERTSRAVLAAVLGESGGPTPSTIGFTLWFDGIVLLLWAAAGSGLWRALRAVRGRAAVRRPWVAVVGVLLRLAVVAVLLAAPGALGYGWGGMALWAPDLALSVTVLVVLLAAAALVRTAVLLRSTRRDEQREAVLDSADAPELRDPPVP